MIFQIVQTRILSVIAWYYLAFFAISVAMLGMTAGAVWVYLHREEHRPENLARTLAEQSALAAFSMPLSLLVQLSLVTTLALSLSTLVSWSLLLVAMAVPYVSSGIVVSLALTRSPYPVNQVYGVDLLGAALGCIAVIGLLNVVDGPTAIVLAGWISALAGLCFARSAVVTERRERPWYRRPGFALAALTGLALVNTLTPLKIHPVLVKDALEPAGSIPFERWNSYSRIAALLPTSERSFLWGASPKMPADTKVEQISLKIDGAAGTQMFHYDGTRQSLEFLRWDLVNLAYNLPGIHKAAVIGVGGGRDVFSAHLYGVEDITGVELNQIFIDLHTKVPYYRSYSNLITLPKLRLVVDDARSWFAATPDRFDLIQMSMIDTWAATGAGAFSLSENGLYTLEGWRAFLGRLSDSGVFTVSRWYSPGDLNETGRMIGLASAALMDAGVTEPERHMFVARASNIATLVLTKQPLTAAQIAILRGEVERLGFSVLLAPDQPPETPLLAAMVASRDIASLNRVAGGADLDLTVSTDDRPFFFNQLRFADSWRLTRRGFQSGLGSGVIAGNLKASGTLALILVISLVAVVCTILLPLRGVARDRSRRLIAVGSVYFSLIGIGFMLAEIALVQYFSVYLGHPIYSLGVCLFSLILASGLGSLASGRLMNGRAPGFVVWGILVTAYLFAVQHWLGDVFQATTGRELLVRVGVALAVVMPLGFLLGFAFPTGMRLVEAIDSEPTPWFWGINGAMGVLASVLAVMLSMAFGIRVTLLVAATCYLCLIPTALALAGMRGVSEARSQEPVRAA
jgi:spermidine synthase